jgi:hypothetical protein
MRKFSSRKVKRGAEMKFLKKIRTLVFRRSTSTPVERPAGEPGADRPVSAFREAELPEIPFHETEPADNNPEDPDTWPWIEISEQIRIAGLWKDQWREYVVEEYRFRLKYHKSCKCDVCGKYHEELFSCRDQTYCATHLPVERQYAERKTRAGRHGSSQSFLKKIP